MIARLLGIAFASALVVAACNGSSGGSGANGNVDAGDSNDASAPDDASGGADSSKDGASPLDAGSGWTPTALKCPSQGSYNKNNGSSSMCGAARWPVKTGTDTGAKNISLTPTLTTVTDLVKLPAPATLPQSSRIAPTEDTLFVLENVKIQLLRLEDDSDYHIVIAQGPYTMIGEIPFPGCVSQTSPWYCLITRARAAVDAKYAVDINGMNPQVTATIVGVGFFDDEHGQTGAAGNNIELHAILGICFGDNCTPNP